MRASSRLKYQLTRSRPQWLQWVCVPLLTAAGCLGWSVVLWAQSQRTLALQMGAVSGFLFILAGAYFYFGTRGQLPPSIPLAVSGVGLITLASTAGGSLGFLSALTVGVLVLSYVRWSGRRGG